MTIDELMAMYAKSWTGYKIDGKGFLVPTTKDLLPFTTKASEVEFATKGLDPKSKMFIGGMANAKEIDRMNEVLDPVGMVTGPYVKNSVMLYQHNHSSPIGLVTALKAEDQGVLFEGWVGDPAAGPLTRTQEEVRSLVAQRVLKAVSVGFIPQKIRMPAYNDQGIMVDPAMIELWELLELSIVAVPCNSGALFDMKSGSKSVAKKRLVSFAAFPTLGKDGTFIISPKGGLKKMDEEMKELLAKQNEALANIASGINALKDGQNGIQKTLDTIGSAKAEKPKEEPAKPAEEDEDDKKKAADALALSKRVDGLEKSIGDISKSIDMISEHIIKQTA